MLTCSNTVKYGHSKGTLDANSSWNVIQLDDKCGPSDHVTNGRQVQRPVFPQLKSLKPKVVFFLLLRLLPLVEFCDYTLSSTHSSIHPPTHLLLSLLCIFIGKQNVSKYEKRHCKDLEVKLFYSQSWTHPDFLFYSP